MSDIRERPIYTALLTGYQIGILRWSKFLPAEQWLYDTKLIFERPEELKGRSGKFKNQ
jgi:hypothetical protein